VRDLQDVVEIAAGFTEFGHTTYYARRDGAVWTWRDDEEEVTRRDDIANAVGLRAGTSTACAIHADRGVSCWGLVGERLNDGHRSSIAEPIEIDLGR
jgi:hypothetical protein